jgi:hypothetical protein
MQFAKVFDIHGTQVLCLLQPRDEDGLPELKMVTYVGTTCVVFGNRLVPLGETVSDPSAVLAKTRELFEGFGQAEAEQAYQVAQKVIAEATRERAEQADGAPSDEGGASSPATDADFGVPLVSTAVH